MLYVAYGSNLHPVRLSLRLPESRFRGTAEIGGRRLCFHKTSRDDSAKCNIVRDESSIHVALYDVSSREKLKLDEIEGIGFGYAAESIRVPGYGDGFTYVAMQTYIDEQRNPYYWYRELVLAGCELHGFPAAYVARIRSIATIDDPDRGRHAANMRIVEQARRATNINQE
jgi:gamma-glutamylcyclotransferase